MPRLPLPSGAATSQTHGYDFVEANNFGGTADVVVSDRAGNETIESFSVVNDTVAPTRDSDGNYGACASGVEFCRGLGRGWKNTDASDGRIFLVPVVTVGMQVAYNGLGKL